ncbi:Fe-S cluster assembly protein SufD [Pirellulaceae bacterium SH449]
MVATEISSFEQQHAKFQGQQSVEIPDWANSIRLEGMNGFRQKGLPTTRDEEWRFTNIAPLLRRPFQLPVHDSSIDSLVGPLVEQAALTENCDRLVFINGRYSQRWSRRSQVDTQYAGSLADSILKNQGSVRQRLLDASVSPQSVFSSLNSAFIEDGALIDIPDDVQLSQPIHLLFITVGDQSIACHPRNLISLGRNSQATIIESHVGHSTAGYFNNCFTEIKVAESAKLYHHKLQQEQIDALHVATTRVQLQSHSSYDSHYFAFGGALARNEVDCFLDGEEIDCTLNGLYMPSGEQLMDCRTRIDHAKPNCRSNEIYKGILDNKAKGVFNGKIYVHPQAQKTNAMQSNQAILLSDDAVIDTKPQLEIYADDVRCTHGATVGELDAQALNYLRSRGIPMDLARAMLIFAFANDIVQSVNVAEVRKHLESLLLADRGLPEV